ncbi:hypothetical protein F0P96_00515 [Hymenobacter busanensis]|uniref:Uncharacterized protein n=1 Tax=Hymenobacter busanensis TaxID=2607656 RepID=A0A7L4ZV69_9BACT|nr:hypothetical protein [Hymenobacter busanensis]KAA9339150.1 hypothetical protein F0P96_00515 [Hymenobacter busanensis]QHJ07088.1 hypothetical protein GUY19_07235 [Hymenobacter busanensis]
MKIALLLSFAALVACGACSRDETTFQNPKSSYGTVKTRAPQRQNDRSRFKEDREKKNGTLGFGLSDQTNNPYKFQTVKAPKKYKYTKPKGY